MRITHLETNYLETNDLNNRLKEAFMKNKPFYEKNQTPVEQGVSKQSKTAKLGDVEEEEFLKLQNKCYVCGGNLDTHIENLPKSHIIVERAQCQSCMTLVRVKNHSLN